MEMRKRLYMIRYQLATILTTLINQNTMAKDSSNPTPLSQLLS